MIPDEDRSRSKSIVTCLNKYEDFTAVVVLMDLQIKLSATILLTITYEICYFRDLHPYLINDK